MNDFFSLGFIQVYVIYYLTCNRQPFGKYWNLKSIFDILLQLKRNQILLQIYIKYLPLKYKKMNRQ